MKEHLQLAVFTTKNVLNGNEIIRVYHDDEGMWSFFCVEDVFLKEEDAKIISLKEMIQIDKSLIELIYILPKCYESHRLNKKLQWEIKMTI